MRPIDYMLAIDRVRGDIFAKQVQLDELRQMATGIGAVQLGEKVQTSGGGDRMSSIVLNIVTAEKDLAQMEETYCEIMAAMQDFIGRVPDHDERLVLTLRLIGRLNNSRSAEELRIRTGRIIRERQERRLYNRAIGTLNRMWWTEEFGQLKELVDNYEKLSSDDRT